MSLKKLYEPMAGTRLKFARVDVTGEPEERSGVLTEVADVEHCLRIREVGEVYSEAGINAVSRTEVRYAAGDRDACSSEYYYVLCT